MNYDDLLSTIFSKLQAPKRQQFTAEQLAANPMLMFMPQEQGLGSTLGQALPFLNYSRGLNNYYKPAQSLLDAMSNPNSEQYQNIYQGQRQMGQEHLAESVDEISRQNRKLRSMGRQPLLDDERGGESIFRNLTKGYQDVQHQAANDTQSILGKSYEGALQQGQLRQQNDYSKAGVNSNIYGALGKLFGL